VRMRVPRSAPVLVLGAVVGIAVLALLWQWTELYLAARAVVQDKDRIGVQNELLRTAAQVLGGLIVVTTLWSTWRGLALTRESQITERFAAAVELLGDATSEAKRLGGVYALERIARDSQVDHRVVTEILAACVRERRAEPGASAVDGVGAGVPRVAQAALTVLGRRPATLRRGEPVAIDLRNADLRHMTLQGGHFEGGDFRGAQLDYANLKDACLEGANLYEASLVEADMSHAQLRKANLNRADLQRALLYYSDLRGAQARGANLVGASLAGADLREASLDEALLKGAIFTNARLQKATLRGADLSGAVLQEAEVVGANFSGAILRDLRQVTDAQRRWLFPASGVEQAPSTVGPPPPATTKRVGESRQSRGTAAPRAPKRRD
jgi:uncharacterized protein YjbI with pentapeptide repeats